MMRRHTRVRQQWVPWLVNQIFAAPQADPRYPRRRALQTPALADETSFHFQTFVSHKGQLIELDGRRESPINHGPIAEDSDLLESAVEVIKKVVETGGGSVEFNVTALVPAEE